MSIFWLVDDKGHNAKAKTETSKQALVQYKGYRVVRETSTCSGAVGL